LRLLENSTYETKVATALKASIAFKKTRQEFEDAKKKLLANQMDINGVQNPSAKDINAHVRKISKQPA
jgi:predicted  nucleic acid-binding Zn-ribbon protein